MGRIFACGIILAFGAGILCAQQPADSLPSAPTPASPSSTASPNPTNPSSASSPTSPATLSSPASDPAEDPSLPTAPSPQPRSAPSTLSTPAPTQTLTFGERLRIYEHSFMTPESLLGPAFGAAVSQADNTPPEWGQGMAGYGRRLASGYGRSVISRTIGFGVASVDREDSRFVPSNETGVWRRTRHAIMTVFVSKTPDGGEMPAISRFVGIYGAAFIANTWEPPSQDTNLHAFERGSTALASSVGWHIFEEFWPDIRHFHHH